MGNKCDMEDERVVASDRGRQLSEHLGKSCLVVGTAVLFQIFFQGEMYLLKYIIFSGTCVFLLNHLFIKFIFITHFPHAVFFFSV